MADESVRAEILNDTQLVAASLDAGTVESFDRDSG